MSKYIIEIKPEYEGITNGIMILGAKEDNLFVDTIAVENLEQYTPVDVEKIYDKAYRDGYNKGLKDGKAVHDKSCEGCKYANVAGTHEPCVRCSNSYKTQWTAKDDKIEVGDEVEHSVKCFVVTVMNDEYVHGIAKDGTWCYASVKNVRKTGRHFDIAKILEDMRHD